MDGRANLVVEALGSTEGRSGHRHALVTVSRLQLVLEDIGKVRKTTRGLRPPQAIGEKSATSRSCAAPRPQDETGSRTLPSSCRRPRGRRGTRRDGEHLARGLPREGLPRSDAADPRSAGEGGVVTLMTRTRQGLEFPVGPPTHGGRHVPTSAVPGRPQGARGGAPPRLRRHHARPGATPPVARGGALSLGCAPVQPPEPLPRRDPRRPAVLGARAQRRRGDRPPGSAPGDSLTGRAARGRSPSTDRHPSLRVQVKHDTVCSAPCCARWRRRKTCPCRLRAGHRPSASLRLRPARAACTGAERAEPEVAGSGRTMERTAYDKGGTRSGCRPWDSDNADLNFTQPLPPPGAG